MDHKKKKQQNRRISVRTNREAGMDRLKYRIPVLTASIKRAGDRVVAVNDRVAAALSRFASKRFTLPLFVVFSFFCLWLTAAIGGYNLFHLKKEIQFTFYQLYLCDFSAGFCSRVIVGAIIGLFMDTVSIAQMKAIANGAVIVSFVLFSFVIGQVLRRGLKERAFAPVLFAAVLLFEPVVVQSNYLFLGTLDVYTLILFLCTLCAYGTPFFYIAAPVFSALGLMVHYHYFFSFLPAVMALTVYDIFLGQTKRRRVAGAVGAGATGVTSGGLFLYLVFFAKNHLKCTPDEFFERMAARFDISVGARARLESLLNGSVVFRDYFDYYIFGYYEGDYYYGSGISFIDFLRRDRISRTDTALYFKYFAYTFPVFVAFIVFWLICSYRQKGSRRIPYVVFACVTLALFPELFISSDVPRWVSATLTCQFALLFAVYLNGDAMVRTVLGGSEKKALVQKSACVACAVVYIAVMLYVGRALPIFK